MFDGDFVNAQKFALQGTLIMSHYLIASNH